MLLPVGEESLVAGADGERVPGAGASNIHDRWLSAFAVYLRAVLVCTNQVYRQGCPGLLLA